MSEVSSSDWSETPASNNASTPDGWPEGQSPSSVNNCAREMMSALKKFWGRINGRYASTGSSNAYVVSPDVAPSAYVTGERYSFRASFSNTGACTVDFGPGAKSIKKMGTGGKADPASGDIQSGAPVTVEYDGTDLILCTPIAGAVTTGRTLTASTGLTGGGDLSADRSFAVDVATQANMEAQTANKVATAANMNWHPGVAKAWGVVTCSGTTYTLAANHNVASINRTAAGSVTVTIDTDFSSVNYAAVVQTIEAGATARASVLTAGTFVARMALDSDGSAADVGFAFVCFGDQA